MSVSIAGSPELVPRRPTAGSGGGAAEGVYSLRFGLLWRAIRRQPLSFWLVTVYMLFEYVRPQAIYPALASFPWAQLSILAAPIAYLLEGGRMRARNPINLWLGLFVGAVLLSWAFAQYPAVSEAKMSVMANWVLAYLLVANLAATEARFFLFYLLFLLASFKMSQHGFRTWAARGFGFASWGATGAPGWFHNSGEFGIQMCIFFPLTLYFIGALRAKLEKWKRVALLLLPFTAVASIIATNSRGALLGGAAVGLWLLLRTRYPFRGLLGLAVLAVLVLQVMPEEQKERFSTMGEDKTSESRLTYWRHGIETFKQHPITGIGYENWGEYYRGTYGRVALPHNVFIQALAELGLVGTVALLGMIVASFVVNHRTAALAKAMGERGRFFSYTARGLDGAMIGFMASAFFVTVLYYPFLWFSLGLTSALHAATVATGRETVDTKGPTVEGRRPGWRTAPPLAAPFQAPGSLSGQRSRSPWL